MLALEQQSLITDRQTTSSVVSVLSEITQAPVTQFKQKEISITIKNSLTTLFPEQEHEERAIKRTKEILGPVSDRFTSEQIRDITIEVQYLVSTWLDDFEKKIFDGLTLQELLHEKGGV